MKFEFTSLVPLGLPVSLPSRHGSATHGAIMSYRVYARWPQQKTSDKTTTDSRAVAEFAFDELVKREAWPGGERPLGVAFTHDGKQVAYRSFAESQDDS